MAVAEDSRDIRVEGGQVRVALPAGDAVLEAELPTQHARVARVPGPGADGGPTSVVADLHPTLAGGGAAVQPVLDAWSAEVRLDDEVALRSLRAHCTCRKVNKSATRGKMFPCVT